MRRHAPRANRAQAAGGNTWRLEEERRGVVEKEAGMEEASRPRRNKEKKPPRLCIPGKHKYEVDDVQWAEESSRRWR
jgi:hypothetical protein